LGACRTAFHAVTTSASDAQALGNIPSHACFFGHGQDMFQGVGLELPGLVPAAEALYHVH
jgi:hypothetical protein